MAEAAVDNPTVSSPKYFCHKCSVSVEISPNVSDLTCPKCDSGFIEELTTELEASQHARDERPPSLFLGRPDLSMSSLLSNVVLNVGGSHDDLDDELDDDDDDDTSDEDYRRSTARTFAPLPRYARRSRGARPAPFLRPRGLGRNESLPRFLENLLVSLTGGSSSSHPSSEMPRFFQHGLLNGDPRDYAWGTDGLDNIITELLNQMEGSGPPPASEHDIETLGSTQIQQEHIDLAAQCSVCMEDFELDESVKQLPCNHLYHNDCIVPWLKQHGTCPICRNSLAGASTMEGVEKPLPMSHNASSSSSSSEDGFADDLHPREEEPEQYHPIDTSSNDTDTFWEDAANQFDQRWNLSIPRLVVPNSDNLDASDPSDDD